jgi:hypothetical protein
MDALTAPLEEPRDEPIRRERRDELDLPAARKPELRPSEALVIVFARVEELPAQRIHEELHRVPNIVHRDGNVVDRAIDHSSIAPPLAGAAYAASVARRKIMSMSTKMTHQRDTKVFCAT